MISITPSGDKFPFLLASSAANLLKLTPLLRMELKSHGISVTIAYPGSINTNISINAIEKDGSKHGIMDPAQKNGMSAEDCAKHYIRAIKKGRAEVLIGGKEFIMYHLKRFFPRLFFKLIGKVKPT